MNKRVLLGFFTVVFGSSIFAASTHRVIPKESIQRAFALSECDRATGVCLKYDQGSFVLSVGKQDFPLQDCFVAEPLRKADWEFVQRYIQAGGKFLIKRVAANEFQIAIGGGLKGGGPLVLTLGSVTISCEIESVIVRSALSFIAKNILGGVAADAVNTVVGTRPQDKEPDDSQKGDVDLGEDDSPPAALSADDIDVGMGGCLPLGVPAGPPRPSWVQRRCIELPGADHQRGKTAYFHTDSN